MPLYVHLVKLTREGAGKIRDLASEQAKGQQYGESLGAKILCAVACFGEYDFVYIAEYPNEVAALKAVGYATSTGYIQIQTLPACQIEDFFKVMSELPR